MPAVIAVARVVITRVIQAVVAEPVVQVLKVPMEQAQPVGLPTELYLQVVLAFSILNLPQLAEALPVGLAAAAAALVEEQTEIVPVPELVEPVVVEPAAAILHKLPALQIQVVGAEVAKAMVLPAGLEL